MEISGKTISRLIEIYEIGDLIRFERIKKGFMNYSYIVETSDGKYVLRISKKTKKKKDRLYEIEFVNSLKNLNVPQYIKDKKGKYINNFQGLNYAIYKFIEGETPKKMTKKLVKEIAIFLGKMHKQSENIKIGKDRFAWYDLSDEKIKKYIDFVFKKLPEFRSELWYIAAKTSKNRLPLNLPKGPIHCDIKRENILEKNGKLNGVVDFDNFFVGSFLLDLAISITWFCIHPKKGFDYNKIKLFVQNYQKYRKLTYFEKENLFRAIKYACYSHELVDFYVYSRNIITEDYFNFGRSFFIFAADGINLSKFNQVVIRKI